MKVNTKLSPSGCWKMVNAIQNADTPEGIRFRCAVAAEWLTKNEVISIDEYNDLMNTVAYLCRESYRMGA